MNIAAVVGRIHHGIFWYVSLHGKISHCLKCEKQVIY